VNIYDVARAAGVSIATASKALNGRKDVREETRAKILQVAKELNYHPSQMARGLAKRRSENIGLMTLRRFHAPIFTNPFYSRVLEGIETEVTKANYNLLLSVVAAEQLSGPIPLPKMVREKNVDALMVLGEAPREFLVELSGAGLPLVVIDTLAQDLPGHYVVADHAQGIRQLVQYLHQLGHRRIGFVNDKVGDASFKERELAFMQSMQALGLAPEQALHMRIAGPGAMDEIDGYLKSSRRPQALLCCNDQHALLVMERAKRLGLAVPRDLSVVGFDDIDEAERADPPLTTVRVEKQEMGAKAVQVVMDLIAHPGAKPKRLDPPVRLMERASAAPPA